MEKFPVLISIPHGGEKIPQEIVDRVCLSKKDIFDDIDPFTGEIYDLGSHAIQVIKTDIARTFVDLNRAENDRPPENPDGVYKTLTVYEKPIYFEGKEPYAVLNNKLIQRYYLPYHNRIENAFTRQDLSLALDCHTMDSVAPPIAPDSGKKRPLVCLGNRFGEACDFALVEKLAICFREAFKLDNSDVTINQPFAGGFITRKYGKKPIPWIQIELSRALYLVAPYFDPQKLVVKIERLRELNRMFRETLAAFFDF